MVVVCTMWLLSYHSTSLPNRFSVSRVTPNLLLCAAPAVREEALVSLGVSCVISAAPELPPPPLPPQVTLLLRLPLKDHPTEDLLSQLHSVTDRIHQVNYSWTDMFVYRPQEK